MGVVVGFCFFLLVLLLKVSFCVVCVRVFMM